MTKIITGTALTLVSALLLSAPPASAAPVNAGYGYGTVRANNPYVVQVKAGQEQFGNHAFKRQFDGSPRARKRRFNRNHRPNGRRFGGYGYWNDRCISPRRIHRRLVRQGWSDFHNLRLRRNQIRVKAYRPNGLLYSMKIQRCTGYIISTQLDWRSVWNIADYFGDYWSSFKKRAHR